MAREIGFDAYKENVQMVTRKRRRVQNSRLVARDLETLTETVTDVLKLNQLQHKTRIQ